MVKNALAVVTVKLNKHKININKIQYAKINLKCSQKIKRAIKIIEKGEK